MDAVALVSVLSSATVAVAGVLVAYRTGHEQRKQELRLEEARLRKEFHLELYRQRLDSYRSVWVTLGAVSDVSFRLADGSYAEEPQAEDRLRRAAAELYEHLYDEAGLLMAMETRNWLHVARRQALDFLDRPADPDSRSQLVNAFYYARRALRNDLGLKDDAAAESIESLAGRIRTESRRSA